MSVVWWCCLLRQAIEPLYGEPFLLVSGPRKTERRILPVELPQVVKIRLHPGRRVVDPLQSLSVIHLGAKRAHREQDFVQVADTFLHNAPVDIIHIAQLFSRKMLIRMKERTGVQVLTQ